MGGAVAAIGLGLQIIGGITNANAQREQGQAQEEAYKAQQEAYNMQADEILLQGQSDTKNLRTQTESLKATQKTQMAANGMFANSATYEDILSDTAYREKLDELTIEDNANRQAAIARKSGAAAAKAGANAARAGEMGMFGSLLGTASQVADSWYQWKKTSKGAA